MKKKPTILDTMEELNRVCDKVYQQTDDNDHTGAKITIAKACNLTRFCKLFEGIKTLHDIEGSMPQELCDYRRRLGCEMMAHIKNEFGEAIYKKFNDSL